MYNFKKINIFERLQFFLSLLTTKYWSSASTLIGFSLIINIFYSLIFYIKRDDFINNGVGKISTLFDSIYFSIITFTTLGFGDIVPIKIFSRMIVISEVLIGYTVLGLLVFLLSKKISKLF